MSNLAFERRTAGWPMTHQALQALEDELGRLRADVARLATAEVDEGEPVDLRPIRAARRLEQLTAVHQGAQIDEGTARAVIGRRASLLEEGHDPITYALVYPGEGDPAQGWISADSPLGAAILGAQAGDRVEVVAPAGRRLVTVVAVD